MAEGTAFLIEKQESNSHNNTKRYRIAIRYLLYIF